ncbi:Proline--tRNA ligase [Aliarcobacter thereius]|uniref:Proline--tRNA ligase n=1 Tax=Aliarcobacter thereius LMG 24486 TaxID=1032240 RepID=A0A1C7WP49_9BACT|nr:proline--tRNA ligase [Aliarcobacter thereius]OCL87707.1 Proline--tRNA ligase [Aliarcobacter thereius]OCL93964.1 Proline--tRNA ligase [Aliarcobacter thereius]OCL95358.1 Proline--tRNA ligase [Aliarcobacter thereius LMG 24486]QBF16653.1 prolyl-tRNA synthetase [Aliarcobacter thereius LMG 24486]TLS93622.1 proline--tRNA ligase [Aliarcobacter thereius]
MKFSRLFIPTTKETPNDATLASHQYLLRGGFVSQTGAGIYDFMPLGKIVLDKIRNIVKEEMDNAGANEVQFGFVTPLSLWEESGRATTMGNELLRFKDRKNASYVLSPTNEESVVNMVKNRVNSYKDLPLNLYQINTKFRDEARPRFGLMRGREFLMKDAYSFHSNEDDLVREFNLMEETYKRIYTRLGLDFRVVEADSGAIGGSGSKEFHVLADSGEDTIVVCDSCSYAANIEAATRRVKEYNFENASLEKIETVNCKTIEEVASFLKVSKEQTVKAVIKKAIFEDKTKIVVFFIRGSDELEETKATNSVNALELLDASEDEINEAGIVAGYCGFVNLDATFVIDNELKDNFGLVCGANEENYHFTNADLRTLKDARYFDLIAVQEGDNCSCCGGKLSYTKGIEAGHIFQLGTKYSSAMNANFLDENGKAKPFVMGCYGVGVSRLVAAVIEQNHDDKGCIWTKATAPFMVDIIVSNSKKEEESKIAEELYNKLKESGVSTILDDRINARFGFKMGDFELLGFPYAIVIGKKLEDGLVEIVSRKTLEKIEIKVEDVLEKILELIK